MRTKKGTDETIKSCGVRLKKREKSFMKRKKKSAMVAQKGRKDEKLNLIEEAKH